MNNYDTDKFTLRISKLASLHLSPTSIKREIILRKQCWKKVGQKFVLAQTEIDLTISEVELLVEASKLLEILNSISQQSAQIPPPEPPPRATF